MKDVVIVSACRTAIGSFGGSLRDIHAYKIASAAMKEAVKRAGIDPAVINDVRFGCCLEPYNALNVARVGAIDAGIPPRPLPRSPSIASAYPAWRPSSPAWP